MRFRKEVVNDRGINALRYASEDDKQHFVETNLDPGLISGMLYEHMIINNRRPNKVNGCFRDPEDFIYEVERNLRQVCNSVQNGHRVKTSLDCGKKTELELDFEAGEYPGTGLTPSNGKLLVRYRMIDGSMAPEKPKRNPRPEEVEFLNTLSMHRK